MDGSPSFPTDRTALLCIVRTFVELLFERVVGDDGHPGHNAELADGLDFDQVAEALLKHNELTQEVDESLDTDDNDRLAVIVAALRTLFEQAR